MSNDFYTVTPISGVDLVTNTKSAVHALGTPVLANNNTQFVYVQSSGATVSSGAACTVTSSFLVTATSGGFTATHGFADGDFGWVKV